MASRVIDHRVNARVVTDWSLFCLFLIKTAVRFQSPPVTCVLAVCDLCGTLPPSFPRMPAPLIVLREACGKCKAGGSLEWHFCFTWSYFTSHFLLVASLCTELWSVMVLTTGRKLFLFYRFVVRCPLKTESNPAIRGVKVGFSCHWTFTFSFQSQFSFHSPLS